jgi:hypothetical protein
MRLAIIIVNYRTPKLVIDCLASVQSEIEVGRDAVAIVDNASADDSLEQIEGAIAENGWSQWVKVIASPVNGGFSSGNNLGIAALAADAYLLLNSDTIVRPGAIAKLLAAKDDHPEAGIISPRLEWLDGTPQISCFRYHSPVSELIDAAATGPITKLLEHYEVALPVADTPIEPEWTSFACVLIRREVIERVGLMDEGYFMFFDDTDYCRRVRNAGWKILHYPDARIVHLRGGSSPVKSAIAARKRPPAYLYVSRSRYYSKFYGASGLWMANLLWLAGRSISLARELAGNKQSHISELAARDIWTNWRNPCKFHLSQLEKVKADSPLKGVSSEPLTR